MESQDKQVYLCLRVSNELARAASDAGRVLGISRSAFVRIAIAEALNHLIEVLPNQVKEATDEHE